MTSEYLDSMQTTNLERGLVEMAYILYTVIMLTISFNLESIIAVPKHWSPPGSSSPSSAVNLCSLSMVGGLLRPQISHQRPDDLHGMKLS